MSNDGESTQRVPVTQEDRHLNKSVFIRTRNSECDIPEIRSLKTSRPRTIDIENLLEMLVQGVEKAITETPEKEEDGHKSDRPDGFS